MKTHTRDAWRLVYELPTHVEAVCRHAQTGSALETVKACVHVQEAVHDLLANLRTMKAYPQDLAWHAYRAAGKAVNDFELALDTLNGRYCETGKWVANGLAAYQAVLETSVMCRGLRAHRLGLADPSRLEPVEEYDYAE